MQGTRSGDREHVALAGRAAGRSRTIRTRSCVYAGRNRRGRRTAFRSDGHAGRQPLRIVTAFAHRGDDSWFYKLQGSEAVVAAQKPAFLEFLKSVRIKEGTRPLDDRARREPAPKWTVPEGWQAVPVRGRCRLAKFAVPAVENGKAEVAVSVFPSDTGGTLANVNRWRRQLGLEDIDEAGLKDCVTPLEGLPGAQLADLTKENRRMLGAIVPRDGRWWFYKMMGDAPAVNAARRLTLSDLH